MSKKKALLVYEMCGPSGSCSKFRDEMKERAWRFSFKGQQLPNNTCFATFEKKVSKQQIIDTTKFDLKDTFDKLFKNNTKIKLTHYIIMVKDGTDFRSSLKCIK